MWGYYCKWRLSKPIPSPFLVKGALILEEQVQRGGKNGCIANGSQVLLLTSTNIWGVREGGTCQKISHRVIFPFIVCNTLDNYLIQKKFHSIHHNLAWGHFGLVPFDASSLLFLLSGARDDMKKVEMPSLSLSLSLS